MVFLFLFLSLWIQVPQFTSKSLPQLSPVSWLFPFPLYFTVFELTLQVFCPFRFYVVFFFPFRSAAFFNEPLTCWELGSLSVFKNLLKICSKDKCPTTLLWPHLKHTHSFMKSKKLVLCSNILDAAQEFVLHLSTLRYKLKILSLFTQNLLPPQQKSCIF